MKNTRLRALLAGLLSTAIVATAIPMSAQAASKTADQNSGLQQLELIETQEEENTQDDLPDRNKQATADHGASLRGASNGDLIVALDPGHGGPASGAVYGGIKEKDINLTIAMYVKQYLEEYAGVQVYMTRTDDTDLSLSKRVEYSAASGADVFVSLHNNAATNEEANGSMVFYPNESYLPELSEEGKGLSQSILSQLVAVGLADKGIHIRNSGSNTYEDGSISDYYGVIRNAKLCGIPGIIVEHAFLSNEGDRVNYLTDDATLKQLAMADAIGIASYYNLQYAALVKPYVELSAPNHTKLRVEWDRQDYASGYIVYRSQSPDKGFVRVAKLRGRDSLVYTDTDVKLGQEYYYKVRAYNTKGATARYSEYSDVFSGHTIGTTTLTSVKQISDGYFRITWKPYEQSTGYALYRSEEGGTYGRIATITDPDKGAYNDRTATPGVNYTYKIRPLNTLYNLEGFGKATNTISATLLRTPNLKRIDVREDGTLKVVWEKALGTSRYVVKRSTEADGDYQIVATITDDKQNYYVDKNAERGRTYYYTVNAYNQFGPVKGSTGFVDPQGAFNLLTPVLDDVSISDDEAGVNITWEPVTGVAGYRIYRSTRESSGFKKLKTISDPNVTTYTDTTDQEAGQQYFYKVKAFVRNSVGTVFSESSETMSVFAGYGIMGKSNATPADMVSFFESRGYEYPDWVYADYGAPTLEDFCQIVYDEAKAEGVKAEVVFAQVCKETGFLQFGGDVFPEQCNFAGIGATGGGEPGNSFDDVATGIRAQVQHLKAYASDLPLNQECVDPRFNYVKRGVAVYVEWLGIQENPIGAGWATGRNYGYSLRDDYIIPLLNCRI